MLSPFFYCSADGDSNITFYFRLASSIVVKKKKKMIASFTFFDGFTTKNGDLCLFWWFCYKEGDGDNVITFLYGGTYEEGNGRHFFFFFFGPYGLVH
jgi:hypothetical protein